jgi:hypothetical protein
MMVENRHIGIDQGIRGDVGRWVQMADGARSL